MDINTGILKRYNYKRSGSARRIADMVITLSRKEELSRKPVEELESADKTEAIEVIMKATTITRIK